MKRSDKQSKVSRIDRSKALAAQADFDPAIRERIRTAPAYMYTSLCPDPGLRRPPRRKERAVETVKPIDVQAMCLICRKRYPVGTKQCTCGGHLYTTGIYRSAMSRTGMGATT